MLTSLAIVEDNAAIRGTLGQLIAETPGLTCLCACENARDALRLLPKHAPDIVIMDIQLPDLSGIECTRRLKRLLPQTQILIFTVYEDNDLIFRALEAGASGYLLKRTSSAEILDAITDIRHGGAPMSSEVARKVVQSFRKNEAAGPPEMRQLSAREEEILGLLTRGYTPKEIGEKLSISYETVRSHLKHIYEKLHVRSQTEAVLKAVH
ncbi:MAG: response regulator transcription factor [Verrucomicrobiota bacterium]|nr:response regulator transcription factor [Verrucomicrobiota bacterium]